MGTLTASSEEEEAVENADEDITKRYKFTKQKVHVELRWLHERD